MKKPIAVNSQDMVIVAQVFESGSISAACKTVGLERTSLSRRLRELERRVGVQLFDRSGKNIRLTDVGSKYLVYCDRVRELVEEAETCVTGRQFRDHGVLSIVADFEEAGLYLASAVNRYVSHHPRSQVVTTLSQTTLTAVPESADLLIQIAARRQPGTCYVELGMLSCSLWASPGHLSEARYGDDPGREPDLAALGITDASDGLARWRLGSEDKRLDLDIRLRFRFATLVACRDACVGGLGVALLPDYLCAAAAAEGTLQRAFPDWRPRPLPLTAAHDRGDHVPRRILSFLEFCRCSDLGESK